jgi:hypothetical protein
MDYATIDETNTRAICDEIGERLKALLKSPESDRATDFEDKIDQLSTQQSEDDNGLLSPD